MPRDGEPKTRVHLWLANRDLERLDALWGRSVTRSAAVQRILRSYLDRIDERAMVGAQRPQADISSIVNKQES